jgi:hypothetical protein
VRCHDILRVERFCCEMVGAFSIRFAWVRLRRGWRGLVRCEASTDGGFAPGGVVVQPRAKIALDRFNIRYIRESEANVLCWVGRAWDFLSCSETGMAW